MPENAEQLVLIEVDDRGHLFKVTTHTPGRKGYDYYAFEWSQQCQTHLFHLSGLGPSLTLEYPRQHRYWLAPNVPYPPQAVRRHRVARLPRRQALSRVFAGNSEDHVVFCAVCDDWLPGDDSESPCEHVWWCLLCNDWSTPTERCGHPEGACDDEECEEEPIAASTDRGRVAVSPACL